ncbi:hypothetical protein [Acetohalobium arabaticum]|uniref:Uncharacterized protein n=1 Tax=Acetohalobium arabaticum (strain ATCC 49924 / DSM 5501 / Z-7288) TaxID=574087 RepID=D9QT65_ACEAZ|nr:hypothetical protein [Acetohalobium arabaticum]ADL13565.1 conserved hypothetical protein [Acetohalobium arabaticum DSM 5501]
MNEAERIEEIKDMINKEAVDGVITCAVAHKIAKKKKTSVRKVGELVEELDIKIKECQLGCF